MTKFTSIFVLALTLGFTSPSFAADFTGLGTNLGGGTSLMPTSGIPDLLTNPFGQLASTTTTVPGATPGATSTPAKQCNIGGAVLVVNPAPNSPVTLQATVSNQGNVTVPAGSCN
jgi:hypothetical protein